MNQIKRKKQHAAKVRARTKTQRASAFTLDDVRGELARSEAARADLDGGTTEVTRRRSAEAAKREILEQTPERRSLEPASLAEILGFNPVNNEKPIDEESTIQKKFIRYYRLLIELRDHVKSGLDLHTEETLKRSSREDSGDLSGYGQHMADAGTDTFDRDFALSLVSNEQEALYEISEAINRIKKGTYGVCELTGDLIDKDRLLAVPFARFSVSGQAEMEKLRKRSAQRGGAFTEVGEDGPKLIEDDND